MAQLLKGNSTGFTHQSLFRGLGEYDCISEKSCMKPFVLPQVMSPESASVGVEGLEV